VIPDLNVATPLQAAVNYDTSQTKLQMLNRLNQGEDIQFSNQLIRDAAAHAQDPESWDAAMQQAAKRGAPEAAQYVGRYTPLLQQRLFESYAGAVPGAGTTAATSAAAPAGGTVAGGLGPEDLDRRFQNVPPERMAGSLAKLNLISDALTGVRDQQTWQAAIQRLQAAGVPVGQYASAPYSPLMIQQAYANIQPVRQYLQNRLTASGTGVPGPLVKNEMQIVDKVGYDPYTGKALTPTETEVVPGSHWPNGEPVLKTKTGGIVPQGQGGGGVSIAEAIRRLQPTENSTGNPAATNPRSSSMGNHGFTNGTWLETIKATRPELAKTLNDQQLLALRALPELSDTMAQAYANKNVASLKDNNLPITTSTIALAHKFGAAGAKNILTANQNTPMEQVISAAALRDNPELKGQTVGDYARKLVRQVGNDPINIDAGGGAATGGQMYHKDQFTYHDVNGVRS